MSVKLEKQQPQFPQQPEQSFGKVVILVLVLSAAIVLAFAAAFEVIHFLPSSNTCVSLDLKNPPPPRAGGYDSCGNNPLISGQPVIVDTDVHTGAIPNPFN